MKKKQELTIAVAILLATIVGANILQLSLVSVNPIHAYVQQGQSPENLGLVLDGMLKAYFLGPDGREFIRSFPRKGWPVAPIGAQLEGLKSDITIRALQDSTVATINFCDFRSLLQRHSCWKDLALKTTEKILVLRERREQLFLVMDARERYDYVRRHEPDLLVSVAGYELAAYLGISPVSLSRIRKQMVKKSLPNVVAR